MAEMKYLRERRGLIPSLHALYREIPIEILEPSSQSPSSEEEMEFDEQTALPYIPQVAVPVQPLETSTSSANLQVSEMA
jgi:hypothetical protein